MKKLCLLFAFIVGCASVSVENTVYRKVVELPGMTQGAIFNKSQQWIAMSFVSGKAVTEYANASEGKIIGNFTQNKMIVLGVGTVRSKIEVDIKPGRARLSITPISIRWGNSPAESYDFQQSVIDDLHEGYQTIYGKYSDYMLSKSKKDNW